METDAIFGIMSYNMNISRRNLLQITGVGVVIAGLLPRMAFAARNALQSMRTGIQPNGRTRIVIETSGRPSYTLVYGEKSLTIKISNTAANNSVTAKLASGTLVKSLTQAQIGDALNIIAELKKPISEIPKNQIMILEPNGDNDYRLVLDFVAASASSKVATTNTNDSTTTTTKKHVIVLDAGHGGKDPGCIGKGGTKEKTVVLSVVQKLRTALRDAGFTVYLTRGDDTYLKLGDRAAIAEKKHADLFLSVHANANPSRSVKGFSIYTLSEKASDEEAVLHRDCCNLRHCPGD